MLEQGYGLIPNSILFNKELTDKQKLLFCLLSSLCAEKGYCWASNSYIAEKLGVNSTTISTNINKLQDLGFIYIEIDKEKGNQRQIAIMKNQNTYFEKSKDPILKNQKHNNINIQKDILLEYKSNKTMQILIKIFTDLNIIQDVTNNLVIEVYDYCINKGKEYLVNDKGEFIPKELEKKLDKYYTYRNGSKKQIKNIKSSILNFLT